MINSHESHSSDDLNSCNTKCNHSLRLGPFLCAICGAEIQKNELLYPASYTSDEILQTSEIAYKQQEIKNKELEKNNKMILILDLDQTIIHTSLTKVPYNLKFSLNHITYYTKYRPYLKSFLKKINKLFEIHVYTMGSREYADKVCQGIDPGNFFFGGRIVSRNENFNELTKKISRISCIHDNVIILDDRIDVWNNIPNLILVRPFYYYNNIDINDPYFIKQSIQSEKKGTTNNTILIDSFKEKESYIETKRLLSLKKAGDNEHMKIKNADELSLYKNKESDYKYKNKKFRLYSSKERINNKDTELIRIYKLLKKTHRYFFKKKKKVQDILNLFFFKDKKFISDYRYIDLIKSLGGKIDFLNPDFIIEDKKQAEIFKLTNIHSTWIFECIYNRKLVDYNNFIINDFRSQFDDEDAQSLLDEFS